ncbi:serine--tRNA ligase [Paramagnetospirillum magneticum]|uniref:Serine--tRNA ligase n=1 Tax=Paramagnetospirillum magneticum (strain ATCC 700264 / AMB-1) TaxID=342108 RepID=SYS_PARM1|nr:serine--tRNA ligase [Paramagnetospirillum magneticum]Q2W4A0.1 RecName: Full=Serine--tRNA ligase; AltName: Full=Seryl-tRNA synthetase; Short=SerRS; AltName: Full=Seryl-tRNA(Ser/Sec) synthetase [Paramagnetospirillum magneticum AMB-1]BAE51325.1 Seryl-tRNA synthetase [Paramagnetospirillum magneticum AMB-1]
MHDLKSIRDNPDGFDAGLKRRGLEPKAAAILDLDTRRRAAQTAFQEMQARRNDASKQIGALKKSGGDASALMDEVASLKERMPAAEEEDKALGAEIESILASIPNLPASDVPDGPDEDHNVELRKWGTPKSFAFTALDHDAIGAKLGLMDFDGAAKLSGARFVVLKGQLARLQRAIGQFMLDLQTVEHGYTEMDPPLMVKDGAAFGTGQLPKFGEDLFKTNTGHWLIPTAEVPLTNLVSDEILDEKALPLRMTALTPCFRSEAGAAGKDTRGMIRQHQFHKVEMVSIAHPDASGAEHERMTQCAETVLQRLGLAYRVIVLCTGDMGFSAQKTYDIEVWLPGQQRYREISSCSNCGDFQARRMKARFRPEGEKGTRFVHTLNGSGLAVGRTLIAVMENYQREDGTIEVPEALRPYMGGLEVIG